MPIITDRWITAAAAMHLPDIAARLGLTAGSHNSWGPCPACSATTRSAKGSDRRGPLGAHAGKPGWLCHSCGETGDAVSLAALVTFGAVLPPGDPRWSELRARFEGEAPPVHSAPPLAYPPEAEVAALLDSCAVPSSVPDDPAVRYLLGRGFGPVGRLDRLVRILPRDAARPDWWPFREHRIVANARDERGATRSVHARAHLDGDGPKTVWPRGHRAGLVFTDHGGAVLLRGGWTGAAPEVLIGEGLTGMIGGALHGGGRPVICGTSGSWATLGRVTWPPGTSAIIATDCDEAGERYATEIRALLPPWMAARRVVWPDGVDLGDAGDRLPAILDSATRSTEGSSVRSILDEWGSAPADRRLAMVAALLRTGDEMRAATPADVRELLALVDGQARLRGSARALRDLLAVRAEPLTATLIPGWDIDDEGVYRIDPDDGGRRRVIRARIEVTGRAVDSDSGDVSLRVRYAGRDHWHPRATLADSRAIVALAAQDAPVDSVSAKDVVSWLADSEAVLRPSLPSVRLVSRLGWVGAPCASPFVVGSDDAGIVVRPGSAAEMYGSAIRQRGTLAGWLRAWEIARRHPVVALALYAGIVPLLLDCVPDSSPFAVDWSGPTRSGKTSTLRLAASVWGDPDERGSGGSLVHGWDATRAHVEGIAAAGRGIAVHLDDTARGRKAADISATVYDVIGGVARGRARPDGIRATARWSTILLSTGEQPLSAYAVEGGAAARILCLWGRPFGDGVTTDVDDLRATLAKHHGHVGPAVVAWLADRAEWVASTGEALLRQYRDAATTSTGRSAAGYVAMLALASEVATATGIPACPAALDVAWEAAQRVPADADRPRAAMDLLVGWCASRQAAFWRFDRNEPSGGWVGAWPADGLPAVLPDLVRRLLDDAGYPYEATIRAWADRGWLERQGDRLLVRGTIGQTRPRLLQITAAAWPD